MDYPSLVAPGGRALRCPHCQHDLFYQRSWLLNTPGMTFFGMEWLNDSATCYVCARCGRIEWFTEVPSHDEESANEELTEADIRRAAESEELGPLDRWARGSP